VALLLLAALLPACSSVKPRIDHSGAITTYCDPPLAYEYDASIKPIANLDSVLAVTPALKQQFSRHDLLMANAVAIVPLLQQLRTNPTGQEADRLRQQIQSRLLLAQTQVSSVAAELDCEGERADQLATYLDQQDDRRVRRLTIGSVLIGAITTVATALILGDDANKTVAISGGLISAGMGGAAAFSSGKRVPFQHSRNLLTDIWQEKKTSVIYPPTVWYVLHETAFSNSKHQSIAYNTRQRWLDYVLQGSSADEQSLYFGKGGRYSADDLHTRANMLNQLQSSVRSINQDLQSLLLTLAQKRW
jgi:hypothetical protein